MRIDKYLKVSRIIKRRTLAQEVCNAGRVFINGKVAKPSSEVKIGDIIEIQFAEKRMKYRVLNITQVASTKTADSLYEVVE